MKLKFKDGTIIEVSDSKGKSKEEIIAEAKKVYKDFRDSQKKDSFITSLGNGGIELDSFVGLIYPCKNNTWSYKLFNEEDNINLENELNNNPNKKIYSGELCYDENGNIQYYAIEKVKDVSQEELNKREIGEFSNVYKAMDGLKKAYRDNLNVRDSKKVKDESIVLYPNEKKSFEIEYPNLEITYSTVDIHGDWVDYDATIDFTLELSESDVIDALYNIIKPDDDFFSDYASDEDDINIDEIIENNIFPAFDYYYNELKDYFEETARDEATENIDDYLPSDPREEYNPDED